MRHLTCGLMFVAALACSSETPMGGPRGGALGSNTSGVLAPPGGAGGVPGGGTGLAGVPMSGFGTAGRQPDIITPPPQGGSLGIDEEDVCSSVMIEPIINRSPGNLLVIFDRSFSMTGPFAATGSTRLAAVDSALMKALDPFVCRPGTADMEACVDVLTVGAILFPTTDVAAPDNCATVDPLEATTQITWTPATQFVQSWSTYWAPGSANNVLPWGTPIPRALERAEAALQASTLPGKTAVLFLTDGESNCDGSVADAAMPGVVPADMAAQWLSRGISTHVVSVAEVATAYNDQVAMAGGTMMSLNPANADTLTGALASIIDETVELVDCVVGLNGKRIANAEQACALGEVYVGPNRIACDPANGFQIRGDSELELVGDACLRLQEAVQDLSAKFPCEVLLQ